MHYLIFDFAEHDLFQIINFHAHQERALQLLLEGEK